MKVILLVEQDTEGLGFDIYCFVTMDIAIKTLGETYGEIKIRDEGEVTVVETPDSKVWVLAEVDVINKVAPL